MAQVIVTWRCGTGDNKGTHVPLQTVTSDGLGGMDDDVEQGTNVNGMVPSVTLVHNINVCHWLNVGWSTALICMSAIYWSDVMRCGARRLA